MRLRGGRPLRGGWKEREGERRDPSGVAYATRAQAVRGREGQAGEAMAREKLRVIRQPEYRSGEDLERGRENS